MVRQIAAAVDAFPSFKRLNKMINFKYECKLLKKKYRITDEINRINCCGGSMFSVVPCASVPSS